MPKPQHIDEEGKRQSTEQAGTLHLGTERTLVAPDGQLYRKVRIVDHDNLCCEIDLRCCSYHGLATSPHYLAHNPERLHNDWLVEQFTAGRQLELWHTPHHQWIAVQQGGVDGVGINDDQLRDLYQQFPVLTITTTGSPQADGPFEPFGFRWAGMDIDFTDTPLLHRLVCALWDQSVGKPHPARKITHVMTELWPDDDEADDKLKNAIARTCSAFRRAGLAIHVKRAGGKLWLKPLGT
jgi:hypothetical protein